MNEIGYTLIFIKTTDKLLLGYKKRGFGVNTWNGYGGKLQENEDISEGAIRELYEESNLHVCRDDLIYLGVVSYDTYKTTNRRVVHIFTATKYSGDLQESEEMRPKWFKIEKIPYETMWPDSKYWVPLVLNDSWLNAQFTYQVDGTIVEYKVSELPVAPLLGDEDSSHDRSFEHYGRAI